MLTWKEGDMLKQGRRHNCQAAVVGSARLGRKRSGCGEKTGYHILPQKLGERRCGPMHSFSTANRNEKLKHASSSLLARLFAFFCTLRLL
jgi:hypothetical protein